MTSLCRRLLLRQAFSKSRHFSWDIDPANTMAYDNTLATSYPLISVDRKNKYTLLCCYVPYLLIAWRLRESEKILKKWLSEKSPTFFYSFWVVDFLHNHSAKEILHNYLSKFPKLQNMKKLKHTWESLVSMCKGVVMIERHMDSWNGATTINILLLLFCCCRCVAVIVIVVFQEVVWMPRFP